MSALVSLPENCGTNPGGYDWSWSTDTPDPGLLSVSFLMDPDLSPFVSHYLLTDVTKTNNEQIGTS